MAGQPLLRSGTRPFFELTVRILKSTVYWRTSPMIWNIPTKIASMLNYENPTNPFNVRWREHHKYTGEHRCSSATYCRFCICGCGYY
ncbi:hypothetical protein EG68_03850 [Paragonimus skrjabini miyazakii]|uniref:Uncharacterized protein n=1 Tax=Paragonimus skrjabini miyazakii TaxID=59628 RepID=A0A8S9Z0D1_9TREM|nr:hypothetical protein EG68_03850 [Paragonimus skrjabini miyazakii]